MPSGVSASPTQDMRAPAPMSGLMLKKSPGCTFGDLEMNENSAMNSVLVCISPAGDATGPEYVWFANAPVAYLFESRSD